MMALFSFFSPSARFMSVFAFLYFVIAYVLSILTTEHFGGTGHLVAADKTLNLSRVTIPSPSSSNKSKSRRTHFLSLYHLLTANCTAYSDNVHSLANFFIFFYLYLLYSARTSVYAYHT